MKLLILGGTGAISASVAREAVQRGYGVTVINRGSRPRIPGTTHWGCDVHDRPAMNALLKDCRFDAVADFLTYLPEQAERNIALFENHTAQYLFISSATVYRKPPQTLFITESEPLSNPFSPYAQNKIACENTLMAAYRQKAFPVTIVRPSYTYADFHLPFIFNSHRSRYAIVERMLRGKPVVIPGDGSIFWTITHADDFARAFVSLAGRRQAVGQAFHITTDERHTWDAFAMMIADALNVKVRLFHIATDTLTRFFPEEVATLDGDKAQTAVFDNTKIKAFAPDFVCKIPFRQGIRACAEYFETHPESRIADPEWDGRVDRMVRALESVAIP
jgi:nucleoside-diphosphate-sugar epimerase